MYVGQQAHYVRNSSGGPEYPRLCQAAVITVADMPRENEVCLVIFGSDHSVKFRDHVPWQSQEENEHDLISEGAGTWHLAETCRNPKARVEDPGYHSRAR